MFARNMGVFFAFIPSCSSYAGAVVDYQWCHMLVDPQLQDHTFSFRVKSWKESERLILSEVAGRQ